METREAEQELWFDVGFKRYTTMLLPCFVREWLWFDVGFKRYTTAWIDEPPGIKLWFDVGVKRYTTSCCKSSPIGGCGLM